MEKIPFPKPSTELKQFMALNGLETLSQVIALEDEKIQYMEGFTYHILKEILQFRKL